MRIFGWSKNLNNQEIFKQNQELCENKSEQNRVSGTNCRGFLTYHLFKWELIVIEIGFRSTYIF